eukprot:Pgem_evm2s2286
MYNTVKVYKSYQLPMGFVDSFRYFYPDATGHFTYWSQRAMNRPWNRGLRLDYAVCSESLLKNENEKVFVHDSYILPLDTVG